MYRDLDARRIAARNRVGANPSQPLLVAAMDEMVQLRNERTHFQTWFRDLVVNHCHVGLTDRQTDLNSLAAICGYLSLGYRDQLSAAKNELGRLLAEEAAVTFDNLNVYLPQSNQAIRTATTIFDRYNTGNIPATNIDLATANGNFGAPWVASAIEASQNLRTAQAALNYAGQATHLVAFRALTATFRGSLIPLAYANNCSVQLIQSLANFGLNAIPPADTFVILPQRHGENLPVGLRSCSFRWIHFLNAHHFDYAVPNVLISRTDVTSFWPAGTALDTITGHLVNAMLARADINGIYAVLGKNQSIPFSHEDVFENGITSGIGIRVVAGRVSITQFYPSNGGGITRFNTAQTNLLGNLLLHHN